MTAWYFHSTLTYVMYIYGIFFYGIYSYGTYFYKAKNSKLLTGLICEENYKIAQRQNFKVKQIFIQTLLQSFNEDFVKIATFLV